MKKNDLKQAAARYAGTIIEDKEKFFDVFDTEKDNFTPGECAAVVELINLYYNCKTGVIGRDEAVKEQNKILKEYGI